MKRIPALIIAMLLLVSLAACTSAPAPSAKASPVAAATLAPTVSATAAATANPEATASATEPSQVGNEFGWAVPKDTLTMTFYSDESEKAGNQADEAIYNKPMDEFLLSKFNVVLHKLVFAQDMTEKLNLMLAASDYPEMISGIPDEMAETFISQGKALDLTGALDQFGPVLKSGLGKYLNLMKTADGKIYKLPKSWGNTTDLKGRDFSIRYDMWTKSGLPMFTNMEEFYKTVKAIVAANPKTAKGETVYALSCNDGTGAMLYNTPLQAYGFKQGYKVDDTTGTFTHWMNTDEGLTVAKYINRFVREGLMDPDFLNNKWEDWQAKVTNERVIAMIGTWWHVYVAGHEAWIPTEGANYKPEKRFVNVGWTEAGAPYNTLLSDNYIRSTRNIVTDKSTQPENIIKWWNWEATDMGRVIIAYGVPGPSNVWDLTGGKAIFTDNALFGSDINNMFHKPRSLNGAYTYWVAAPGYTALANNAASVLDPRILPNGMNIWGFTLDTSKFDMNKLDPIRKLDLELNKYYQIKSWDATLFASINFKPDDPITTTNQNITDALKGEWAKIVTAKSEGECADLFKAAQKKLNELGLKDLEKYYADQYKINLDKLNAK